jgi:hypothetical protein
MLRHRLGHFAFFLAVAGCTSSPEQADVSSDDDECPVGTLDCACDEDDGCDEGLECRRNLCQEAEDDSPNTDDDAANEDDAANDDDADDNANVGDDDVAGTEPSAEPEGGPVAGEPVAEPSPAPVGEPEPSPGPAPVDTITPEVEPAAPAECSADRTVLPIDASGWVPAECNDVEIQGAWYCYSDGVNPTSCPGEGAPYAAGRGMCLSGNTTIDPTYEAWGAGIGLTLNQDADSSSGSSYDAASHDVVGFRIATSGNVGGARLRVQFTSGNSGAMPFVEVDAGDTVDVMLADAIVPPEWPVPEAGTVVDPSSIFDLQVAVAGGDAAFSYDFCITGLSVLVDASQPEPTPEPAVEPEPAAEPVPEPAAEPVPEPAPEPIPEPAPEPIVEPEPTGEYECTYSSECAVGEACNAFCTSDECEVTCERGCDDSYDGCNATEEAPYSCWGRSGSELCMLSCGNDYDCPSGQLCLPHAAVPDGSNFNGEEYYCRPPCVDDSDCTDMSQGQVGNAGLDCTCVSSGRCVLNPNENELGFECYQHRGF